MSRRLRDSDLLNATLRYSDPENSISGLKRERPDAALTPTIIGYYEERPFGGRAANPDKPFVWCCHCQKQTHWEGFVVTDTEGGIFIIGKDCGRKHYGADFVLIERNFQDERLRQALLKRWTQTAALLTDVRSDIAELLSSHSLAVHDAKKAELEKASPDGFLRLGAAVRRGALKVIKRNRNLTEEARRSAQFQRALEAFGRLSFSEQRNRKRQGLNPQEDDTPIYVDQEINLGHVVGTSMLGFEEVRPVALTVRRKLEDFENALSEGTDKISTKNLVNIRRDLLDAVDQLRGCIITTQFGDTFFNNENLNIIQDWSQNFRNFRYYARDEALEVWDQRKGKAMVERVDFGELPKLENLERLYYVKVADEIEDRGIAQPGNENDPSSPKNVA